MKKEKKPINEEKIVGRNGYDVLHTLITYTGLVIIMLVLGLIIITNNYSQIDELTININTNEEMTEVFKSLETITDTQYKTYTSIHNETVKETKSISNETDIFLENIPKRNATYEIQTVEGRVDAISRINNTI